MVLKVDIEWLRNLNGVTSGISQGEFLTSLGKKADSERDCGEKNILNVHQTNYLRFRFV